VWAWVIGRIDTREKFDARRADLARERLGRHESERFARVPRLSRRRAHGLRAAGSLRSAPAQARVRARSDLHRLSPRGGPRVAGGSGGDREGRREESGS
jgi:hypothetical protein